ncbi:MAG: glycerophosphodiester phosphodiesterase family protein, partial [Aquihabitans sp.]
MLLFAHRGGFDGGHPQNSLAAMADALERGCSLESDVRLSADGVPVLVHDAYRLRFGVPLVIRWTSADRLARVGVVSLAELYR